MIEVIAWIAAIGSLIFSCLIFKSAISHYKEMKILNKKRTEKLLRDMAIFKLRQDVLHNYGVDYMNCLPSYDEMMEDDKPVTMINYFNTDCLKIK